MGKWTSFDTEPCVYLELTFFDAANMKQTERYRMRFPDYYLMPLNEEPTYDRTVRLNDYRSEDGSGPAETYHVSELIETMRRHVEELAGS